MHHLMDLPPGVSLPHLLHMRVGNSHTWELLLHQSGLQGPCGLFQSFSFSAVPWFVTSAAPESWCGGTAQAAVSSASPMSLLLRDPGSHWHALGKEGSKRCKDSEFCIPNGWLLSRHSSLQAGDYDRVIQRSYLQHKLDSVIPVRL